MPYISAHQVSVTHEDLRIILSEANPLISSLSELAQQSILKFGKYIIILLCDMWNCTNVFSKHNRYCDGSCTVHV